MTLTLSVKGSEPESNKLAARYFFSGENRPIANRFLLYCTPLSRFPQTQMLRLVARRKIQVVSHLADVPLR